MTCSTGEGNFRFEEKRGGRLPVHKPARCMEEPPVPEERLRGSPEAEPRQLMGPRQTAAMHLQRRRGIGHPEGDAEEGHHVGPLLRDVPLHFLAPGTPWPGPLDDGLPGLPGQFLETPGGEMPGTLFRWQFAEFIVADPVAKDLHEGVAPPAVRPRAKQRPAAAMQAIPAGGVVMPLRARPIVRQVTAAMARYQPLSG